MWFTLISIVCSRRFVCFLNSKRQVIMVPISGKDFGNTRACPFPSHSEPRRWPRCDGSRRRLPNCMWGNNAAPARQQGLLNECTGRIHTWSLSRMGGRKAKIGLPFFTHSPSSPVHSQLIPTGPGTVTAQPSQVFHWLAISSTKCSSAHRKEA